MSDIPQGPRWPHSNEDPYQQASTVLPGVARPTGRTLGRVPLVAVIALVVIVVGVVAVTTHGGKRSTRSTSSQMGPTTSATASTSSTSSVPPATTSLANPFATSSSTPPVTSSQTSSTTPPVATTTLPPPTTTATTPPTTPPTTVPATLVTSAVENQVVQSTWNSFADAFATDNAATLASTSTPAVQQAVEGNFACGCAAWPAASTVVNFSAPPETSYPLYFYAELQGRDYDSQALDKEVVFTKASATQPWLVAYFGAYLGGDPVFGSSAKSESLELPPTAVPTSLSSGPTEVANFFQQIDQTGVEPAVPHNWMETLTMSQLANGSESSYLARQKLPYTYVYAHAIVQDSGVIGLPGADLVFATMAVSVKITPKSGSTIVQPPNRSTWGALLPPGTYHTLTEDGTIDLCVAETSAGTFALLTNLGGVYSITGS